MNCPEVETLLAEFVDGTISEEQRAGVESHLGRCASCGALAQDAAGAVAFMQRAATVEPPPELVTRILSEMRNGPYRPMLRSSWTSRWLRNKRFTTWLEAALEPRFAMGIAMTVLSFAMVVQLPGVRQLKTSDLNPVNLWMAAENRVQRTWERAVKNYENTPLVFEIEAQLQEWDQLNEDPPSGAAQGPESR